MTIKNIISVIQQLESINPLEKFAYKKAHFAYLSLDSLPIFTYIIQSQVQICRSRTCKRFKLFENIDEISSPPNHFVKDFARCNKPLQSKFYGSETRPISYLELVDNWVESKNVGDKLYVTTGVWFTKKPLYSIIVTTPDIEKRISKFDKFHAKEFDKFINRHVGELKKAIIYFYRFLFKHFRKSAKHDTLAYIITSAYCNISITKAKELEKKIDCILYPSVPFKEQGINIAINTEFIKQENIELKRVVCSEMTVSENENKNYTFRESNTWIAKKVSNDSNKIKW